MVKIAVCVLVLLALIGIVAYLSDQPHYQISTTTDGIITRLDTRTGRAEMLVSAGGETKWVPLGERRRSTLDQDFDAVLHPAK